MAIKEFFHITQFTLCSIVDHEYNGISCIPGHIKANLSCQDMLWLPVYIFTSRSHLGYQGTSLVPGHTLDTWEPWTQLRHLAIYNTVGIPGHPAHKWTTKPSGTQLDTWVPTTRLSLLDSQKTLRTQLRQQWNNWDVQNTAETQETAWTSRPKLVHHR